VIFSIFTNKHVEILKIETGTQAGGNLTNEPWNLEERDNPLANIPSPWSWANHQAKASSLF
jgi:hypothetical protein